MKKERKKGEKGKERNGLKRSKEEEEKLRTEIKQKRRKKGTGGGKVLIEEGTICLPRRSTYTDWYSTNVLLH